MRCSQSHKQTNYRLDEANNAHFSILDGKSKIKVLADQCLEEGLPGLQTVTFSAGPHLVGKQKANSLASPAEESSVILEGSTLLTLITPRSSDVQDHHMGA